MDSLLIISAVWGGTEMRVRWASLTGTSQGGHAQGDSINRSVANALQWALKDLHMEQYVCEVILQGGWSFLCMFYLTPLNSQTHEDRDLYFFLTFILFF